MAGYFANAIAQGAYDDYLKRDLFSVVINKRTREVSTPNILHVIAEITDATKQRVLQLAQEEFNRQREEIIADMIGRSDAEIAAILEKAGIPAKTT